MPLTHTFRLLLLLLQQPLLLSQYQLGVGLPQFRRVYDGWIGQVFNVVLASDLGGPLHILLVLAHGL